MNKKSWNQTICTIPSEEVTRLKGLGCLWDKTTQDCFNVRVITRNGLISAVESQAIAKAAQLFGNGNMAMTTRLTIEIQKVPYEKIASLIRYLEEHDLETGGTGRKVRPVVSCKGTTCQYGLIDTFALSKAIHERFYKGYRQVVLPHKFKIGVGGCPNNCVKPDLNDIGIIGQRMISRNIDLCKGCKKCQIEINCPIKVCSVQNNKLLIDMEQCNNCGRCMGKCPFHVTDEFQNGYAVYIGGRWGKKIARGQRLNRLFTAEEDVLNLVEKCILFFREQGQPGERFADTVARIGFQTVQEELLSDDILARKEEIVK